MIKQKILAVFFLLIGGVLLIGSTHAWFTDSTRLEQQLPMGKLEVGVTCYNPTVTDLEPGSTNMELSSNLGETETVAQPIEGVIKNTGSIRAICRLKKEILFKFKYHNDSDQKNGIAIPNDEQAFVPDDKGIVSLFIQGNPGWETEAGQWYQHRSSQQLFLVLDPRSEVSINLFYVIDGIQTTDRYQSAELKAAVRVEATQANMEEALYEVMGVSMADLELLNDKCPDYLTLEF